MMKKAILGSLILLAACGSSDKRPDNVYRQSDDRPLVDDKYSLQADRAELENLRGQIPSEKKRENDELAFILGRMSEIKKAPSEIRNQFDSALRKKRELFDKDMRKERDSFTKEERTKREAFLKSQQAQRDQFNREKHVRDEKNEFYKNLDEKRSEFFSVERDKRNDFESDVRERRKNFEDYTREKQNDFSQELRAYSKRFDDLKKEKSNPATATPGGSFGVQPAPQSGSNSEAVELERELQEARSRPGTPLESGE